MIDSLARLLTWVGMILLVLILLNLFGAWTSDHLPGVLDGIGYILHQLWAIITHFIPGHRH
ncbi:MAG TPA: hypothetical protein VFO16_21105 [Pseudonocardiaceae bacterium]|nr:hypothetical protein [Pseudonocardiaceae bacterium]